MTTRIRRRGERGISRKTIARGMPGLFRCDRGDYARVLCFISHARPRVHWAPGIPCALCLSRRERFLQNLGRITIFSRLFENRINLVVPDKRVQRARSGTHNHQCSLLGQSWPQRTHQQALVVMGPRFRGDDIETIRVRATRWLAMTASRRATLTAVFARLDRAIQYSTSISDCAERPRRTSVASCKSAPR